MESRCQFVAIGPAKSLKLSKRITPIYLCPVKRPPGLYEFNKLGFIKRTRQNHPYQLVLTSTNNQSVF